MKNFVLAIVFSLVVLAFGYYLGLNQSGVGLNLTLPDWPNVNLDLPKPPTVTAESELKTSATQIAEAGVTVPTLEYRYIETQDIEGLTTYLKSQEQDWSVLSHNFHAMEVTGVGRSYQRLESNACDWIGENQNPLCAWHEVGYLSVYRGVITGGVKNIFTNMQINLESDSFSEIHSEDNGVVTVTKTPNAYIVINTEACITNIEETTPSPVNYADITLDTSYTIKVVDDKHLWSSNDNDINEEYLRLTAEKEAKVMALHQENTKAVMQLVASEANFGGTLYQFAEEVFSPSLAKQFGLNHINFKIVVNTGNPTIRCDGSPVIK